MTYLLWTLFILSALYLIYSDLKDYLLPNGAVSFVAGLGIVHLFHENGLFYQAILSSTLLISLTYALKVFYERNKHTPALGFGDIKLFGALGLWIPPQELPWFLIFVGIGGILWGLLWKRTFKKIIFPFSPSIYAGYGILCIARVCKWL